MKTNQIFLINENEKKQENEQPRIKEIGEVKKGFTYHVEKSDVMKRAELFLPMLSLSNKYITPGSCDPEIIDVTDSSKSSERKQQMDEENTQEYYVEMNIATGILEEKHEESSESDEESMMIEEIN